MQLGASVDSFFPIEKVQDEIEEGKICKEEMNLDSSFLVARLMRDVGSQITPLAYAILTRNKAMIDSLMMYGASPLTMLIGVKGSYPLIYAMQYLGEADVVSLLDRAMENRDENMYTSRLEMVISIINQLEDPQLNSYIPLITSYIERLKREAL